MKRVMYNIPGDGPIPLAQIVSTIQREGESYLLKVSVLDCKTGEINEAGYYLNAHTLISGGIYDFVARKLADTLKSVESNKVNEPKSVL